VQAASVVGLASARAMSSIELKLAGLLGCDEVSEEGSLRWGMRKAFGSDESQWRVDDEGLEWLEPPTSPEVRLVTAPRDAEGRRAQTGTALDRLFENRSIVTPSSSILFVTTEIYWIDGHIRLLTRMPEGSRLATAGSARNFSYEGDQLIQTYRSQHYLQEVRSALDALPALLAWAGD